MTTDKQTTTSPYDQEDAVSLRNVLDEYARRVDDLTAYSNAADLEARYWAGVADERERNLASVTSELNITRSKLERALAAAQQYRTNEAHHQYLVDVTENGLTDNQQGEHDWTLAADAQAMALAIETLR
jgi:hypothetical protein